MIVISHIISLDLSFDEMKRNTGCRFLCYFSADHGGEGPTFYART